MVDGKGAVVKRPVLRQRVDWIVKCRAHAPGNIKAARRPHHADGVQPVSILEDFCLQRLRFDIGGKAVCGDGMGGGVNIRLFPAEPHQNAGCLFRRKPRGLRAQR
ncbi:hypothetical protein D3C78_1146100 [compost metagenome]